MTKQEIIELIGTALEKANADKLDCTTEARAVLSALEASRIIWTPENNTTLWGLLRDDQREEVKAAKHGWRCYKDQYDEWEDDDRPLWLHCYVYRAKPAPVVKSAWHNVYKNIEGNPYALESHPSRRSANINRIPNRIGIIRLDLIDGKLSVEVEE